MKGPVTVEAVNQLVAELEAAGLGLRAENLEDDIVLGVLLAVADGHPRSAAIAKAALRAFDV